MRYDTIPKEMKDLPQWVCAWNGSKCPMQAKRNAGASSVNSETWATFDDARAAVEQGRYGYLGFVFNNNDIVGVDIDRCFDDDGFLNDVSIDCIQAARSYTELSKSGKGIHIYIKGKLPFKGKNNRSGVEIYRSSRYFIVTGNRLVYGDLVENQDAIDYIVSKYFPEAERESDNDVSERIYCPMFLKPEIGNINLKPIYPEIKVGMRNLSLTSLAGQLHSQGYDKAEIYKELLSCNQLACKPPLPLREVQSIVASVTKYKR